MVLCLYIVDPVPPDKVGPIPPPEIKTVEHTEKEYSIGKRN